MTTTNLAFQLLAASNYIDALGGVSQSYRQALASYEAEPAVQVVVERERVWVKRGVQSFMLAYEAETDAEREWYAGQLRSLLAAPVAPAGPVIKVLVRGSNAPLHVTGWYGDTVFVDLPEAAPAAPAPAWQPIETAPKECVDVLLHIPGRQPVVAAFYRGGWAPVDLGGNHLRGTPTLWMPLPEVPAIAASKGEKV